MKLQDLGGNCAKATHLPPRNFFGGTDAAPMIFGASEGLPRKHLWLTPARGTAAYYRSSNLI